MENCLKASGLSAEDSPASRTASRESGLEKTTSAIYGLNVCERYASYDPATRSLRTLQGCLQLAGGDSLTEFCATFTKAFMLVKGKLYRLQASEPRTEGTESGLWRTPDANMERGNRSKKNLTKRIQRGMPLNLNDQLRGIALNLLPTPTVNGNYNRKGASKTSGDGLATFVEKFPTPKLSDYKGCGKLGSKSNVHDLKKRNLKGVVIDKTGGQLNPTWVEWLMGYPSGWTDLNASVTPLYLSAPK
jgi:hypothetical protein